MDTKVPLKEHILDYALITVGSAVMALSINLFLEPYNIVPGGVTGVAMIISSLVPIPIGMLIILINLPLFFLSWRLVGRRFLISTIYGTVVSSVLIDLTANLLPRVDTEPLLAALFGGVIMGAGLGVVFSRGATTGGSDVAARLLKFVLPGLNMGHLMLIVDIIVVAAAVLAFGGINYGLYAAVTLFVSSVVIDKVLYGPNVARMVYVISERHAEITAAIVKNLDRGVTLLHGEGGYTGAEKKVIICALKRHQIVALKALVKNIDPKAFIILTEAHDVFGEGFRNYSNNSL